MSFPEIKRAEVMHSSVCAVLYNKEKSCDCAFNYLPTEVIRERLSRAKCARSTANILVCNCHKTDSNSSIKCFNLPKDVVCGCTSCAVYNRLLRQAELDESVDSVVAEADSK